MANAESPEVEVVRSLNPGLYVPGEEDAMGRSFRGPITGFVAHHFFFNEPGGTDHLVPGRPLEQTQAVDIFPGESVIFALMGFNGAFTNGGSTIRDRELGQFQVELSWRPPNLMVCSVRLTAESLDQPVKIWVNAIALFFSGSF